MTRFLHLSLTLAALLAVGCGSDPTGAPEAGDASGDAPATVEEAAALGSGGGQITTGPMPVNLYAEVQSDDGHLNLRSTPNSSGSNVLAEIPNGELVLVTDCENDSRGQRWCTVERTDAPGWSPEMPPPAGYAGHVYDAELEYREPSLRDGADWAPYAMGGGVPSEFEVVKVGGTIESEDGYVNLREGPSSSDAVIREAPNGESVSTIACGPGAPDARWCLAIVYGVGPGGDMLEVEMPDQHLGYLYMAEVDVE